MTRNTALRLLALILATLLVLPATSDPEFGIGGLFILWGLVTALLGILFIALWGTENSGLSAPGEIAGLLAREKARFVSAQNPERYVVGADQTLALGTRLFSKPAGRAQAAEQLRLLAGGTHELHSAIAVARDGKLLFAGVSVARMTMRHLSGSGIEAYLDQAGEAVTTSVGAYQLEGLGVHLFERIEGDHFTILGLPLLPLLAFLREQGLLGV